MLLDRERHADLIKKLETQAARVRLITDGDVAAAIIATCFPESGVVMLMGTGGSTEAVLAALCSCKNIGWREILCQFKPKKRR